MKKAIRLLFIFFVFIFCLAAVNQKVKASIRHPKLAQRLAGLNQVVVSNCSHEGQT